MEIILSVAFVLFLAARICGAQLNILPLKLIATPLVTSTSLLVAIIGGIKYNSPVTFLFVSFVIFSLIGDTFNCIGEDYLMYGLIFFAIAHIIMICIMAQKTNITIIMLPISIVLIIVMVVLYCFSIPKLTMVMKIAVPVYMLLATTSVVLGVGIINYSLLFFIGLVLFYISDIFIALFGFALPFKFKFESMFIWLTYAPGIYLMAMSINQGYIK